MFGLVRRVAWRIEIMTAVSHGYSKVFRGAFSKILQSGETAATMEFGDAFI